MQSSAREIIEFTQKLVSTPSQNGIDFEEDVAKLVFEKLASFGFTPKIVGPEEHPSVICYIKKPGTHKTIWLQAPLDTVPAGDLSKWDYPPLEGRIVGNKMYGIGVADAKIAISIFSYLAKELAEDADFNASLFLGFDADEQGGNFTGIKEIMDKAPKADVCILGYQGINMISIGARGWLRLKLTTLGQSAHTGSSTKKGVNAIHGMVKAAHAISSFNIGAKKEPFFEFGSSLNISQIHGGVAINIVPDRCEALVDVRLVPSQSKEEVIGQIKKELEGLGKNSQFKFELEELQYEPAYLTDPQNEFVKILRDKAERKLNKNIPLIASGQGSVGNVISKLGIPIINAFGVESDNTHAPNEWINLDTVPTVFDIYRGSLKEFAKELTDN